MGKVIKRSGDIAKAAQRVRHVANKAAEAILETVKDVEEQRYTARLRKKYGR